MEDWNTAYRREIFFIGYDNITIAKLSYKKLGINTSSDRYCFKHGDKLPRLVHTRKKQNRAIMCFKKDT